MCGKASEHHGVDQADPSTGQHGDRRLGHHRHVNDDPVSLSSALALENTGKARHLIEQVAIAEDLDCLGDRAVINESGLLGPAVCHLTVQGVVASVDDASGEPTVKARPRCIEHLVPFLVPMNRFRRIRPEAFGIVLPPRVDFIVCALHRVLILPASPGPRAETACPNAFLKVLAASHGRNVPTPLLRRARPRAPAP